MHLRSSYLIGIGAQWRESQHLVASKRAWGFARTVFTLLLAAMSGPLQAQATTLSLSEVFDAAWQLQPEAVVYETRLNALKAKLEASKLATAGAPTFELGARSDLITGNQGGRGLSAGIALPLWLPGQRDRSIAQSQADMEALTSLQVSAKLKLAALVRERYWAWQRAQSDLQLAQGRLSNATTLAKDVARRVKAGDLARADQHQADGAVAGATAAQAEAYSRWLIKRIELQSLAGGIVDRAAASPMAQAVPEESLIGSEVNPWKLDSFNAALHPLLIELTKRAQVAQSNLELAKVQTRSNPEITFSLNTSREQFGASQHTILAMALRLPFGSEVRNRSRLLSSQADIDEIQAKLRLNETRIYADIALAQARIDGLKAQSEAALLRARLARETKGFFEKSFLMGESDLPTRLRIEIEAYEAERAALGISLDYNAALSDLRQALGLLPVAQ